MKRIKHFFYSVRMGILIFRKPEIAQTNCFKIIDQILETAKSCQRENKPMAFSCYINTPDGAIMNLFSIWVGIGNDNPIKRNRVLVEEMDFLKKELAKTS